MEFTLSLAHTSLQLAIGFIIAGASAQLVSAQAFSNDADLKILDGISRKYTGNPFPMREPEERVALIIAVDKERYLKLPFSHQPPR